MQKLTTIDDLKVATDLTPYINLVQGLGDHYLRFIEQDLGGYRYDVQAGAERDRKPGIHASEVSGCARRLVYGIGGTERRPDPTGTDANMRMRFRVGTAVHAQLQNEFERMCRWAPYIGPDAQPYDLGFTPEVRINPGMAGAAADHGIESSTDGVFTFSRYGEVLFRMILEIKTASDREYEKQKEPKLEHLEQTHVYMACLNIPFTWLLNYNKSNSNFTRPFAPFFFRYSAKLWSTLEARFLVNGHRVITNELPDRTESIACRWCPFSYTCQPTILKKGVVPPVTRGSNAVISHQLGRRP